MGQDRGGRSMKQSCTFAVITRNNEVIQVGHSVIYQSKTKPLKGEIKWFDDSKLIRNYDK